MSRSISFQEAPPTVAPLYVAVWVYAAGLFALAELTSWILRLRIPAGPRFWVCAAGGLIGTLLVVVETVSSGGPPPRRPPSGLVVVEAAIILILVVVSICAAFVYSQQNRNAAYSLGFGFLSALAWGLSVVGALIWTRLGPFSSVYWNAWFNFFAAAFAALAVGYMV